MLEWIVWNRTFLHLTQCKQKPAPMLNWIVLNRNVHMYKNKFGIK